MAYIGNSLAQGLVSGANIQDGTIDTVDLKDAIVTPQKLSLFSSGTANGVGYLNGSKVLVTGSALQFDGTNFSVGGDIQQVNATYLKSKTSVGVATRLFGINAANNLYIGGIDTAIGDMLFVNNGTEQMRLTSTGLGIGTTSPTYDLDVVKSDASAGVSVRVRNSDATSATSYAQLRLETGLNDASINAYSGTAGAGYLSFFNEGSERMRIDSAGGVGIGTSNIGGFSGTVSLGGSGNPTGGYLEGYSNTQSVPASVTTRFDAYLSAPSTSASVFTVGALNHFNAQQGTFGAGSVVSLQIGYRASSNLTGATSNMGFLSEIPQAANRWNFYAGGTADNYFAGNVGIGISSPTKRLQVESGSTAAGGQAWSHSAGTVYARIGVVNPGVSNDTEFGTVSNNDLRLITNSTERMRIDSSGNVGIGTSSPVSFGAGAVILTTAGTSGYGGYIASTTSVQGQLWASEGGGSVYCGARSSHALILTTGNTERVRIDTSGNVGIGTSSPNAKFHAKGTVAADVTYMLEPYSNAYASKLLISSTSAGDGGIRYGAAGTNDMNVFAYGNLIFNVGSGNISGVVANERARITSSELSLTGLQGIKFQTTQNPSSDANTLDDYEEGTFNIYLSDAFSGGNAYSVPADYVKIGRIVHIRFATYMQIMATWTGANDVFLRGLPFTTVGEGCAGSLMLNDSTGDGIPLYAWQPSGVGYLKVKRKNFVSAFTASSLPTGGTIMYGNLTYQTNT